jgi:arabinogalactan endo-1,4-beta-galactosidase
MAVNLDLHYSDRWADPDHQEIPAAWKGLPLSTLSDSVYQYTLSTLQYLATKNLVPEMIQVGNENNSGMLWPIGHTNTGWAPFAQLLKAGIKAVRDFSKTSAIKPRIILHVAQFQNAGYWSDNLAAAGVTDYDVLGVSHYYKWSTVNNFEGISSAIAQLKSKTGKAVMVVETAFPFTNTNADNYNNIFWEASGAALGFPFSIEGQKNYYTALTQAIVKGGGSGIMVWEPAWISSTLNDGWGIGSSWENNSFFDYSGNLHDGISFMMQRYTGL